MEENMKRVALTIAMVASMLVATVGVASAAPPDHAAKPDKPVNAQDRGPAEKVDVCHLSNGEKGLHLINVSGNALEAHLAHGDVLPGDAVPEMENYEYGLDCEVRSTQVVDGLFEGSGLAIGFSAFMAFDDSISGVGSYSYTINGNTMDLDVMDVCLDSDAKTATVWGSGTSSLDGDGFMVLTLVDDGGSMSARALFFAAEADAEAAFDDQCANPIVGASGGSGFLIFF
jgi:hypothetical protein